MAQNSADAGDVKDDVAALRSDVDKLMNDIAKLAKDETSVRVDQTRAAARKAGDELARADDTLRDTIRDNPLTACGAAIGVGFVSALLMRR